jgi:glyoxylase-like metal-dependent hydrolase (beta-lactamase superfamily II)
MNGICTQIFPNVYQIRSVFGNRFLYQYLFLADTTVLLDTGVANTPNSVIFPLLEKLGVSPRRISLVITTHADADHQGGLAAIKEASPGTLLACHQDDRRLIEDPEFLYQHRYNFLAQDHNLGFGREGMVNCPEGCRIDLLLSAGETLQIASDWRLQIWHVPGHSAGHLAVYDEQNRAAFTSDAVQGNGYPSTDGKMAFGPTYYAVESYLAAVQFLEKMPIEHLYTGHWPGLHGAEISDFLLSSREFVNTADMLLHTYFRSRHGGVTLKQILADLSPKLGTWPDEAAPFLQFAIYGHLVWMKQRGIVIEDNARPILWSLA